MEALAYLAMVLGLSVIGVAEYLVVFYYDVQKVNAWIDYERRLDAALRRAGLDAYADRRRVSRPHRRRREEPPVWNRDRDTVDRSGGADRMLDDYRRTRGTIVRHRLDG